MNLKQSIIIGFVSFSTMCGGVNFAHAAPCDYETGAPSPTGRNPKALWSPQWQKAWDCAEAEYKANPTAPTGAGLMFKKLMDVANSTAYNEQNDFISAAVMYQITGDAAYVQKSWSKIEGILPATSIAGMLGGFTGVGRFPHMVLAYDWLYPGLTPAQRALMISNLNRWADTTATMNMDPPPSGLSFSFYFGLAFLDLYTGTDNPRAGTFLSKSFGGKPVGGLEATGSNTNSLRNHIRLAIDNADGGLLASKSCGKMIDWGWAPERMLLLCTTAINRTAGRDYFPEIKPFIDETAREQIYRLTPNLQTDFAWGMVERFLGLFRIHRLAYLGILSHLNKDNPNVGPYVQRLIDDVLAKAPPASSPLDTGLPRGDFYFFYNPYLPRADWRTASSFPKGYFVPGVGIQYLHDRWDERGSLYAVMGAEGILGATEPQHASFRLFRAGEWVIDQPLRYHQNPSPRIQQLGNNVLLAGLTSAAEFRHVVAQEFGPQDSYAYFVATTGGAIYFSATAPQTYMHENTRTTLYLPSADQRSDTIIVHDRTNAQDPRTLLRYTNYQDAHRALMDTSPRKQWLITTPITPTVDARGIIWNAAGGQTARVTCLLPEKRTVNVLSGAVIWADIMNSVTPEEKAVYQARIVPEVTTQWDTFLNVVQVYDAGFVTDNTLIRSADGVAEGVLVKRAGHADLLAMFNAEQGANLPPLVNGASDPRTDGILRQVHRLNHGYSVTFSPTSATSLVFFSNLNNTRRWNLLVNGASQNLTVSAAGVARVTLSGTGVKNLVLQAEDMPHVTLVKSIEPSNTAVVGEQRTYKITYTSVGSIPANNVVISDVVPAKTSYIVGSVSSGGTYDAATNTVRWILGTLQPQQTGTVSFRVTVE